MKKTRLYLTIAVILGVTVTLVPWISIAETQSLDQAGFFLYDKEFFGVRQPQAYYDLASSGSPTSDFAVIIVSFVIALVAYLYAKHRMPTRPYIWVRIPPS